MRVSKAVESRAMEWKLVRSAPVLDLCQMSSTMLYAYLSLWAYGVGQSTSPVLLSEYASRIVLLLAGIAYSLFCVIEQDKNWSMRAWHFLLHFLMTFVETVVLCITCIDATMVTALGQAYDGSHWKLATQILITLRFALTWASNSDWRSKPMHGLFAACCTGLWVHNWSNSDATWAAALSVAPANMAILHARTLVGSFVLASTTALLLCASMRIEREGRSTLNKKTEPDVIVVPYVPAPEQLDLEYDVTKPPRPTSPSPTRESQPFMHQVQSLVYNLIQYHPDWIRWCHEMEQRNSEGEPSELDMEDFAAMLQIVYQDTCDVAFLRSLDARVEYYPVLVINIILEQLVLCVRSKLQAKEVEPFIAMVRSGQRQLMRVISDELVDEEARETPISIEE